MIGCIANKHANYTSILKLPTNLLGIMNNANLSKCLKQIDKWRVLLLKMEIGWFLVAPRGHILHFGGGVGTFCP